MAKKKPKGARTIKWSGNAPGGNYTEKLLAQPTPRPGEAVVVEVRHDDWCAIFNGNPCNCEPDVTSRPVTEED